MLPLLNLGLALKHTAMVQGHDNPTLEPAGSSIEAPIPMSDTLNQKLIQHGQAISTVLKSAIDAEASTGAPQSLLDAMSYATLNGGKRLRPFLLVETAALFGRSDAGVLRAAAALECIHSYSLVHDDLPALDNDDLRRGKKTTHIAFDEETAILVGDALQTLAFDLLTDERVHKDPATRLKLVSGLAKAAGASGMVGGQMLDLAAEGRHGNTPLQQNLHSIKSMQAMKTGALLRFACTAGADLADCASDDRGRLEKFGTIIGLAFQLADDILDRTGDAAALGKEAGKDAAAGKATLVDFMGLEAAKDHLAAQIEQADALLQPYGAAADTLKQTAGFIASRTS
ncbi:MAG: polyprenyl synthetase family protein [Hyphomicrobiales bacterium]